MFKNAAWSILLGLLTVLLGSWRRRRGRGDDDGDDGGNVETTGSGA